MSLPSLTPKYFAEEVDDAWHVFAARPGQDRHRHVHGPLWEEQARRIADGLNRNLELREEALRDDYWSGVRKC
jgi:hypothetical protein